MSFRITSAVEKMLYLEGRNKIIQGATSSGKTYGIIPILFDRAIKTPNTLITVVAETVPSLKDGCVKIFKDFMYDSGRWNDSSWLGNPMQYTLSNRSKIQFKSFDSEGKAKASGKRQILFINEANHVPFPIADALMIRTTEEVWLDFNADSEFWAHTEVMQENDTDFLKLTYLDNEGIPEGTLQKLMDRKLKAEKEDEECNRGYWWNWWRVYGLGEIGSLQGVVFNNWKQVKEMPQEARVLGYGMDFGYTNDPSTLVGVYYLNGKYYYKEELYSTGLTNSDIANIIKPIVGNNLVYADSAEPKSIEEIRREGINIIGAEKGKDSIMYGINLMQQDDFFVTEGSMNLIKELRNYTWMSDKQGRKVNKPVDSNNHLIDAMRYFRTTENKYNGQY